MRNKAGKKYCQTENVEIKDFKWLITDYQFKSLTFLKCYRVLFSLKKQTIQFRFNLIFIFQEKKSLKFVSFPQLDEKLCLK